MGSRWRWEAVDLGWAMGPYGLIARLLDSPPGQEWYTAQILGLPGTAALLVRGTGTSGVPVVMTTYAVSGGFPYGQATEADAPE